MQLAGAQEFNSPHHHGLLLNNPSRRVGERRISLMGIGRLKALVQISTATRLENPTLDLTLGVRFAIGGVAEKKLKEFSFSLEESSNINSRGRRSPN